MVEAGARGVGATPFEQLVDWYRGAFISSLRAVERSVLRDEYRKELASTPAVALNAVWIALDGGTTAEQMAARDAVMVLCKCHAYAALLRGLQECRTHEARMHLMRLLPQTGAANALRALAVLEQRFAIEDWELARETRRARLVIERLSRASDSRTLPRAVTTIGDEDLVRFTESADRDRLESLRAV
ncbi:MAG: hypothetical protein KGJ62_08700 [Armatimonadetes bacterium]|nr:hypothetical protein [Armatimonadota bacterium]MDE2205028.1 hypothetical protein [Armatimonadota bacterium]